MDLGENLMVRDHTETFPMGADHQNHYFCGAKAV